MRDKRKFCRPVVTKNPKFGDVIVKLSCGKKLSVSSQEYIKIKDFFKIDSMIGSSEKVPGNLKVNNTYLDYNTIVNIVNYVNNQNILELIDIIGNKSNPSDGDILVHNNSINEDAVFSFNDWVTTSDNWDITGLYGITTYEEETAEDGDYVILANGHTLIIKPEDYSKVSSNWEHVDTIDKEEEEEQNP